MKQRNKASELRAEIKRINKIIHTTESPYLRRDMTKYLRRLERELHFEIDKGPRSRLSD